MNKKLNLLLFLTFLFSVSFVQASATFTANSQFLIGDQNVTYYFTRDITADNFVVNSTCLNISGGTYNGSYCNSSTTPITIYIPPGLPEMQEVTINTTAIPVITSMNLSGYCRGVNNIDSNNVTYYYKWYKDGILYDSGVTAANYTSNISILVDTILPAETSTGDEWVLECTVYDGGVNSTALNSSITYIEPSQTNCTGGARELITFWGKDEETLDLITEMQLNVELTIHYPTGDYNINQGFNGSNNYTICIDSNESLTYSSIMEYGRNSPWTDRKYYINNEDLAAFQKNNLSLYHINGTLAVPVTLNVYERGTTTKIEDAYVRILRFYPETGQYLQVEVAKTDREGNTIGKLILYDIFYQFIIEFPANNVAYQGSPIKILDVIRYFPLSLSTSNLADWYGIQDSSLSVTCNITSQICRMSWSSNTDKTARFSVVRKEGLTTQTLYEVTQTAASASIVYPITESTSNREYIASGSLISDAENVISSSDVLDYVTGIGINLTEKQDFIIPIMMAIIFFACVLIDFGAVGIIVGSTSVLVVGAMSRIIPLPVTGQAGAAGIIGIVAVAIIIIYRMYKD